MMLMEITGAVIFLNPQKQQLLYGEGMEYRRLLFLVKVKNPIKLVC